MEKSGGIATNIGVHFFDMLTWNFGESKENVVKQNQADHAAGYLRLEKAHVNWFLSINSETLPPHVKAKGQTTYRSITIDGEEIEFSGGFTDLHTVSYQSILRGEGYGLQDAKASIDIVHGIRKQ